MSTNVCQWMLPANVLSDAAAATWTSSGAASGYAVASLETSLPGDAFRFAGLFRILTGGSLDNDIIDWTDSTSVVRTATLTAGDYTGTTLAAELQTQYNSTASSDVYAVAYSATTGKFTIQETGGPSNFILKWSSGSADCGRLATTIGFDNGADDNGASTYTSDNVVVHSEDWLQVDMGSSLTPGAGWFLGHFLSTSAAVKVYGHSADLTSPAADDSYITHFAATGTLIKTLTSGSQFLTDDEDDFSSWASTGAYRYFAVSIIDTVPRDSKIFHEIGRIGMGTLTNPTRDYSQGWRQTVVDGAPRFATPGGLLHAPVFRQPTEFVGQWNRIGDSDRDDLKALWRVGRTPLAFWHRFTNDATGGLYGQVLDAQLRIRNRPVNTWDVGPLTVRQVPKRVV